MEVKLSQAGPVGHLPRPKVPRQLMEPPVEYCGGVVDLMMFAAFWSSRLLTGSLTGMEEPSGSLCHFKSLARTSLSVAPYFGFPSALADEPWSI